MRTTCVSFLELFPTAIAWELLVLLTICVGFSETFSASDACYGVLKFLHMCYHMIFQVMQVLKGFAANSTRMNIYG